MNINQLSEQLKDVPQNRLVDYAKNPNSVVPQFLALAEIQRRQQLSAQAQPPASTVANDVLAQAQPAPQSVAFAQHPQMAQQLPENQPGVAQLPSRVAPEGFAAGGIVAFADGGLNLDDDEEDREMASLFPANRLAGLEELLASLPGKARSMMENLPKSYDATKREADSVSPKGGHKYEQAVLEEAKRQGVDPALALHVLYKETGNLKDPENARSKAGAIGIMQLMPKTAAGLGVDPTNPMENIRGGISYLKQMADRYKENRLAAAAYNAGPGNLDKALRRQGGLDTLPHETRNYIAGLAKGGVIEHFEEGGSAKERQESALRALETNMPSDYDKYQSDVPMSQSDYYRQRALAESAIKQNIPIPLAISPEQSKVYKSAYGKSPELSTSPSPIATDTSELDRERDRAKATANANKRDIDAGNLLNPPKTYQTKEQMGPYEYEPRSYADATQAAPKSKADLYAEALEKDIEAQAAQAAKDGDMNLYLALMQAGLGMMASKSPYALGGIGEGGQQGVSTYAALQKQAADRNKDIMGARLGLYKYGAAQESAAETRELNKAIKEGTLAQSKEQFAQKRIDAAKDDLRQYEQMRIKQIENKYTKNPMWGIDPKLKAAYDAEVASLINDPQYMALFKLGYPNIEMPKQSSAPATGGWSIKPKQ